jgi:phosphoribosylaminoimidazole-succinocarboxamide synthase
MSSTLWQTELPGLPPPRRGKVRDLYDLGEHLLIVACDRISAFDHVLPTAIPDKGKILSQLTNFWFAELAETVPHHLVAVDADDFPSSLRAHADVLRGRAVLARKTRVVPFEFVARGFLAGSAFGQYRRGGAVCGVTLPPGLDRAGRLPEPIFTPTTKAETGHDQPVDMATLRARLGEEEAQRLCDLTLALYRRGAERAEDAGLILADTKFELGYDGDRLLLIDEVLTPDSSRYWEASAWRPGEEPASFDKQFVRNWLDDLGWDRDSTPPELPDEVVAGTRSRYLEAFRRLVGRDPEL